MAGLTARATVPSSGPAGAAGTERRRPRRLALGLVLVAPLVAEFASGNLPVVYVWLLVAYAPLYGGAALLIRELGRRSGRPWPVIFTLGLAYGVLEESFLSFSLFNPDYAGLRLLEFGWIPALGIGAWWTTFVVVLHAVWSVCVPIALVEAVAGDLSDTPWLTGRGLAGAGQAVVVGGLATVGLTLSEDDFLPTSGQVAGAAAAVALLAVAAGRLGRRTAVEPSPERAGTPPAGRPARAPAPRTVAAAAAGAATVFVAGVVQLGPPLVTVAVDLLLVVVGVTVVRRWSSRAGWSGRHRLALASGALLPHLAFATLQRSLVEVPLWLDLLGDLAFAGAVVALLLAGRRATAPALPAPLR